MSAHRQFLAATLALDAREAPGGRRWLAVALAAASCTTLILALLGQQTAFVAINGAASGLPSAALARITSLGDSLLAVALMLPLVARYPRALEAAIVAALIATFAGQGLKHILDLPRPAAVLDPDAFNLVGPGYRHNSSPSGHTVTAFVWVCALIPYVEARWARLGGLVAAAIVGLSRVAVGAHWPLDIAGGAALGVASSLAAHRLLARRRGSFALNVHLVLVALSSCAAVALFFVGVPYAQAAGLAHILAAVGLGTSGWHYLLWPQLVLARRRRRRPVLAIR